jgi:hypothetical protein
MADPVTLAILKKVGVEAIRNPEKVGNGIIKTILVIAMLIIMLLFIPINFLISIPVLMIDTEKPVLTLVQEAQLKNYKEAISKIDEDNQDWIELKKEQYKDYDDIVVIYENDLKWEEIIAVDTVLRDQKFIMVTRGDCVNVGRKFIDRKVTTSTYTVTETYTYTDSNGKKKTGTREVTKRRATISVVKKSFNEVLTDYNFDSFQKMFAENVLKTILGSADITGGADLEEYPEGSVNLPYYNQCDARWGNKMYGGDTIRVAGCGPTALAMVVSGMTGNKVYPDDVANWSVANGHRAEGAGSYWSLMTAGGRHYGLNVSTASRQDPNTIRKALSEGKPIIVSMGRGHFTTSGHFIVLRGLTEDGKVLVHDPYSYENSQIAWDIGIIMNESSTNGGVAGSPFFIFSK